MSVGSDTTEGEPLWVVGVGGVDRSALETVVDGATETFPVDARIHPGGADLSSFEGVATGGLYHGLDLADYARKRSGRDTVLAVTDVDIAKPRGERAFGLARRGGSVGIVSTARLGDPDGPAFADRLRTVTAQHVGYLVGTGACGDGCLFEVAEEPTDFDRIGPDPCADCRAELEGRTSPLLPEDWNPDNRRSDAPATGASGEAAALSVVAVGDVDDDAVSAAVAAVDDHLPFDASTAPGSVPLSAVADDAYDDSRDQYRASELAQSAREFVGTAPVLVVTDVDVFEARRNYVFGIGEFGGEVAAFSTARLADSSSAGDWEPVDERTPEATTAGARTENATTAAERTARVRKQAVKQAGRLLGVEPCGDRECVFTDVPTVRELDLTGESPCSECRATLDGAEWPPDVETAAESGSTGGDRAGSDRITGSDAGSGTDSRSGDDSGAGRANDRPDEPPGEQGTVDYLWRSLVHDLANTGRFVGKLGGFGVAFFASLLLVVSAFEFALGPWDSQSDRVAWIGILLSLVVTWYLYKWIKRVTLFLGRGAVGQIRSVAGE